MPPLKVHICNDPSKFLAFHDSPRFSLSSAITSNMNSYVDLGISQTIKGSLEHFLTSLEGGNDSLKSFLGHWMSLNDTLQSHHDQLKEETLEDAHNLASTIGLIASVMLELDTTGDLLQREFAKELSQILNDDMENLVIRDELPILIGSTLSSQPLISVFAKLFFHIGDSSQPPYIKPCCQWLLANLHNPYPLKSVRNSICRQTGSPIKDVDAWFTDARKRMGWNQLRRTHFSNKREKIIDAATSFFKPSRDFFKLDSSLQSFPFGGLEDYSMAFIEMEECAQRLFSGRFEETPLAKTLDQDFPLHSQRQNQPNQQEPQKHQTNITLKRKRRAYPSPERSPDRSPEPQSPSMITIPSPVLLSTVSHKRRRSSSEACTDNTGPGRPQKRLRYFSVHDNFPICQTNFSFIDRPTLKTSILLWLQLACPLQRHL